MVFQVPHRPIARLYLRMGIHSGPASGVVVGYKVPFYCVTGQVITIIFRIGLPNFAAKGIVPSRRSSTKRPWLGDTILLQILDIFRRGLHSFFLLALNIDKL